MSDISPTDRVLPTAIPLLGAAEAAAALGASLRLRRDATTVDPELSACVDAVLDALGIREAVNDLGPHEIVALLGITEGFLTQACDFVTHPDRNAWDHEDPNILLAQGHTSTLVAPLLQRYVVPALGDDLTVRMQGPDATFLDVGTGVGALAIAMCRLWPSLHAVGIDPSEPALELAREQVAAAELTGRIELQQTTAEALGDADQFDLAWIPTFFIPGTVLEQAITRVHAALRRGGCAILGLYARPGNPFIDALADLRTVRQGGSLRTPEELSQSLEHAGFSDVVIHSSPQWNPPMVFVAGRRPTAA